MKKLLLVVLAAISLASGYTDAQAGRRVEKQIKWLSPNVSVPDGGFATSDDPKPIASETLDTTGVFNMMDADVFGARGGPHAAANFNSQDSVLVGYVVAYSDSAADGASTLTAATATIDASGDGRDWAVVGTSATIAASDDPITVFALYLRPGLDHQNLLTNAPKLRIRFTAATGFLLAARLKLVYWADERVQ